MPIELLILAHYINYEEKSLIYLRLHNFETIRTE
jgi:hypothetical protein